MQNAECIITLPGGLGTWDELWEMVCLKGIGKREEQEALTKRTRSRFLDLYDKRSFIPRKNYFCTPALSRAFLESPRSAFTCEGRTRAASVGCASRRRSDVESSATLPSHHIDVF